MPSTVTALCTLLTPWVGIFICCLSPALGPAGDRRLRRDADLPPRRYSSFLIRFFPGQEGVPPEELRGQVQHVQSGALHSFVGLEAMEEIMRRHFEQELETVDKTRPE